MRSDLDEILDIIQAAVLDGGCGVGAVCVASGGDGLGGGDGSASWMFVSYIRCHRNYT